MYTVEDGNRHRPLDKNSKQTNKIQTAGYCCLLSISIRTIDNNSFSDVTFKMPTFLTRSKTAKFVLGQPAPLPLTCLPLEVDVYNAVIFTKNDMKLEDSGVTNISVFSKVAENAKEIWEVRGNLPAISHRTVLEKVDKVFQRGRDLQKIPLERRSKMLEDLETNLEKVIEEKSKGRPQKKYDFLQNLFDICTCKCEDRDLCSCTIEKKIQKRESWTS